MQEAVQKTATEAAEIEGYKQKHTRSSMFQLMKLRRHKTKQFLHTLYCSRMPEHYICCARRTMGPIKCLWKKTRCQDLEFIICITTNFCGVNDPLGSTKRGGGRSCLEKRPLVSQVNWSHRNIQIFVLESKISHKWTENIKVILRKFCTAYFPYIYIGSWTSYK
jgi:hypothetical protein